MPGVVVQVADPVDAEGQAGSIRRGAWVSRPSLQRRVLNLEAVHLPLPLVAVSLGSDPGLRGPCDDALAVGDDAAALSGWSREQSAWRDAFEWLSIGDWFNGR